MSGPIDRSCARRRSCCPAARPGLRRRDGHHAARGGRRAGPVAARAEPVRPRPGGHHPRQLPDRRGGHHPDQHVRRQPAVARPTTASPTRSPRSTGPGCGSPGGRRPDRPGPPVLVAGSVSPAVTALQRRRVGAGERMEVLREQIQALVADGGARRAHPGDLRLPGRAGRGGLGGRLGDRRAADRAGHVRRRRAHPRRRDAARGRHRAVRPAGGDARHQLHDRPAADAGRGGGPDPVLGGAGQRPAERRAAAPDRRAQLRVLHRRRLLRPLPRPGSPTPGSPSSAAAAARPRRTSRRP